MRPISTVIDALGRHDVRYVLIGGGALELHGSGYKTEDVDIVYDREPQNVQRLVEALAPFAPRLRMRDVENALPFVWDAQTIRNGLNFTLGTSIGDVDLLGAIPPGWTYADLVRDHAKRYDVDGRQIDMLTLDGLLATKRAAGRPKDHLAIPEIEAMIEARSVEISEPEQDLGIDR